MYETICLFMIIYALYELYLLVFFDHDMKHTWEVCVDDFISYTTQWIDAIDCNQPVR